jgi:hypothetical protein
MNMNFIDRKFKQLMEQIDIEEKIRDRKGSESKRFNFKEFEQIGSNQWTVANHYAKERLEKLGQGSSRAVYVLSSRYVLKIATNQAGFAQNKLEMEMSQDRGVSHILANVHKAHPDGMWLVSDLVKPMDYFFEPGKEFIKVAGFDFYDLFDSSERNNRLEIYLDDIEMTKELIISLQKQLERTKEPKTIDQITKTIQQYQKNIKSLESSVEAIRADLGDQGESFNEYLMAIEYAKKKYGLSDGDSSMIEHWGKTPNGRIVLLDYGLNDEVFVNFYQGA